MKEVSFGGPVTVPNSKHVGPCAKEIVKVL